METLCFSSRGGSHAAIRKVTPLQDPTREASGDLMQSGTLLNFAWKPIFRI